MKLVARITAPLLVSLMLAMPARATATVADHPLAVSCTTSFASVPAPDMDAPAELAAVSGTTSTAVYAAGTATNEDGVHRTFVLRWDGSTWTQETTPNGSRTGSYLTGIDAISASNVWAVGYTRDGDNILTTLPLILHRTANGWSQVPSPTPGTSSVLEGISAVSATDIWAVGAYYDPGPDTFATFVVHWNGAAWSQISSANPYSDPYLADVDATSSTNAWAGGWTYVSQTYLTPVVERWNSPTWEVVSTPWTSGRVSAVATRSASNTWVAIDQGGNSFILSHWDGVSWTDVASDPSVNTPVFADLEAVAGNDVWAVGQQGPGTGEITPLIEHWDGFTWTKVPGPHLLTGGESLTGIDPTAGSERFAVGNTIASDIALRPIAMRAAPSTWKMTEVHNPSKLGSSFNAVSATSATDAWAVGSFDGLPGPTYVFGSLVEHWDGVSWRSMITPFDGNESQLTGVAALSASNVWAVGSAEDDTTLPHPLILHWDGKHWTSASFAAERESRLSGIAAFSASNIWAVGYQVDAAAVVQPLALHYNGTMWLELSPPPLPSPGGELDGVDAVSGSEAVAVGTTGGAHSTLVERWKNANWAVETSQSVGTDHNVLFGVDATSSGSWAAGAFYSSSAVAERTLIEQNVLSSWQKVASPNAGSGDNWLRAIDGVSATDLWAAGYSFNGSGVRKNLMLHRTTGTWSRVTVPNVGGTSETNRLYGIDAQSTGEVWAVGYHAGASHAHPLTLHACGV